MLGQHHSTIAREIDRNGGPVEYRAVETVTVHLVGRGVGVQGFPVTAARIDSKALWPCLPAVET
ncbi:hypothetical protein [Amycolatopsis panacis]|uniref:hypothetical protein n=1 Tax=Amycolatopsis panacis TaxID=2340917 RepID=UPI003898DBD9